MLPVREYVPLYPLTSEWLREYVTGDILESTVGGGLGPDTLAPPRPLVGEDGRELYPYPEALPYPLVVYPVSLLKTGSVGA